MHFFTIERSAFGHGWFLSQLFLLVVALAHASVANTITPAAIVVPPSQYWDGNDGPWSSFFIRVGTPPQAVRVMASTNSPDTWVVLQQACALTDNGCIDSRGQVFKSNESSTWRDQGFFNLYLENNLNYTGNGDYGLETVGLGLQNISGPSLDDQVVAGIVTPDFYFGVLGLNIQPTNFSNFNNPIPSFFTTLKNKNIIPSLSWSYTAGNQYSLKKIYASLVFGGYDASRFIPNSMTFGFASDSTRDLVVGVQSIYATEQTGKTTSLLSSGILAFIDSTVPYLYLPLDTCTQFENAFGLTWDDAHKLYLISDTQHSALLARNATFTFVLGNTKSGGSTISIALPYAAFDLTVKSPLINGTSKYFPLKRADNDTQYTLGRTFLQEAYLIADYERANFSIYQNKYVQDAPPDIVVIHDLNYVPPPANGSSGLTVNGTSTFSSASSSLAVGAIAGIAIGGATILILLILLLIARQYRKWPFHERKAIQKGDSAELDGDEMAQADGREIRHSKPSVNGPYETNSKHNAPNAELDGDLLYPKTELPGSRPALHGELHGSDAAMEVEGSGVYHELAGSPLPIPEYYGNSPVVTPISRDTSQSSRNSNSRNPLSGASEGGRFRQISASPLSESSGLSPVSDSVDSREVGRNETRLGGFERSRIGGGGRNISPANLAEPLPVGGNHEDISRDPGRTRQGIGAPF